MTNLVGSLDISTLRDVTLFVKNDVVLVRFSTLLMYNGEHPEMLHTYIFAKRHAITIVLYEVHM